MSFLGTLFGRKSKTDIANEIVTKLIGIVVSLMADERFSVSAPEITTYLRDKATPDIVNTIRGCDDLLVQSRAQPGLMNPEVIAHVHEALANELERRGYTQLLK